MKFAGLCTKAAALLAAVAVAMPTSAFAANTMKFDTGDLGGIVPAGAKYPLFVSGAPSGSAKIEYWTENGKIGEIEPSGRVEWLAPQRNTAVTAKAIDADGAVLAQKTFPFKAGVALDETVKFWDINFTGTEFSDSNNWLVWQGTTSLVYSLEGGNRLGRAGAATVETADGNSYVRLSKNGQLNQIEAGALSLADGVVEFSADIYIDNKDGAALSSGSTLASFVADGSWRSYGMTIGSAGIGWTGNTVTAAANEWHNIKYIYDGLNNALTCLVDGTYLGKSAGVQYGTINRFDIENPLDCDLLVDNIRVTKYVPRLTLSVSDENPIIGAQVGLTAKANTPVAEIKYFLALDNLHFEEIDGKVNGEAYKQYIMAEGYDEDGKFVAASQIAELSAVNKKADTYMKVDFEGAYENNVFFDASGNNARLDGAESSIASIGGGKALMLKTTTEKWNQFVNEAVYRKSGRYTIDMRYMVSAGSVQWGSNSVLLINYFNAAGGLSALNITDHLGNFCEDRVNITVDGSPVAEECGRWYNIRAVVDTDAKTIEVYLDGKLLLKKENLDMVQLHSVNTVRKENGETYIDDVHVYQVSDYTPEFKLAKKKTVIDGSRVTHIAVFTNNVNSKKEFTLIRAIYDNDGRLTGVRSDGVSLSPSNAEKSKSAFQYMTYDVDEVLNKKVKLMCWDGELGQMLPVTFDVPLNY